MKLYKIEYRSHFNISLTLFVLTSNRLEYKVNEVHQFVHFFPVSNIKNLQMFPAMHKCMRSTNWNVKVAYTEIGSAVRESHFHAHISLLEMV